MRYRSSSSCGYIKMILHECSCFIEFIKPIKYEACRAFYRFSASSLTNSIIQEYEWKIIFIMFKGNNLRHSIDVVNT